MNTTIRLTSSRATCVAAGLVLLAAGRGEAQGLPHAALLQAYQHSATYLASTLQQSNRLAAIDATVTVLAVHRALSSAINTDMARVYAASQRAKVGESEALTLIRTAEIERATNVMLAGNWIGAANAQARQQALEGTETAIAATQSALTALGQALQRAQATGPFPPALILDATRTRQADGTYIVAVTVRNAGAEGALATKLSLTQEDAVTVLQEAQLGGLAAGATARHLFAVALPAGQSLGTVAVTVEAANARSTTTLVDLN